MGQMIRPKATVLPESALVPERNLIQPPPNQFTHEVISEQPYYYKDPEPTDSPDGVLKAGTKVVLLLHKGGGLCRVATEQGLHVVTAVEGLHPIRRRRVNKSTRKSSSRRAMKDGNWHARRTPKLRVP